jgi:hypothetical protein
MNLRDCRCIRCRPVRLFRWPTIEVEAMRWVVYCRLAKGLWANINIMIQ